jgi:WbqC-like protein family
MDRKVAIIQSNYIPWKGYFDLIGQVDEFVLYDDAQYTKRDWRNRNRIAADEAEWLTIPVNTRGRFSQLICEAEIDDTRPWRRQHLESFRRCYARAPFFQPVFSLLEEALLSGETCLADLTIRLSESICAMLELQRTFVRSSQLPHTSSGREERLIEICRAVEGNVYLSGPTARAYIDPRVFAAADVELRYVIYDYAPYPRGPRPFVPNLSIVDALAWLGPRGTAEYLATQGGKSEREVSERDCP